MPSYTDYPKLTEPILEGKGQLLSVVSSMSRE